MADTGTPEWWLRRLYDQILARRNGIQKATDYYDGEHNLRYQSQRFREAFGGLFDAFSDNWCEVVVDAVAERLNITGFRVDDESSGDADAWAIWQANDMDARMELGVVDSLVCGAAYGTAWYDGKGGVTLTTEHPLSAIVETDRLGNRRAGLRLWTDDDRYEHAELFLPGFVGFFRSKSPTQQGDTHISASSASWEADPDAPSSAIEDGNGSFIGNPLGVVPMVELPNRPRSRASRRGLAVQSEIRSIMPLQDAVNKLLADMLVGAEKHALPQRWASGFQVDRNPETNEPIDPQVDVRKILISEKPDARFGDFTVADLSNYTKAIELVVQHIASISRTPPHYLNASADRLSGESIKAAETGLVAKTKRKMVPLGNGAETLMRLSGRIVGNARLANATSMETIWGDPESRTESEHVDATIKLKALNVPDEVLWERAGFSPPQIARIKAINAASAFDQIALPVAPDAGDT